MKKQKKFFILILLFFTLFVFINQNFSKTLKAPENKKIIPR